MRVKLKGIASATAKLADGSTARYWYAWRGGPRLEGAPGSPEFVASYNAAHAARKGSTGAGTVDGLIVHYRASQAFLGLAEKTRRDYAKHLDAIGAKWGTMPVQALAAKRARGLFLDWRDEMARHSPRQADYRLTVLARVLSFAADRGLIGANPLTRPGRVYRADRNDAVWTDEMEAALRAAAGPHLTDVLTAALWTGQRQGDLLRLPWSAYDGAALRLRQSKTRRRVVVPVGGPLREVLERRKAERTGPLIFVNSEGAPWTNDGFRTSWRKACERAKIRGVTFHDLRGTAVTRLRILDVSAEDIAVLTGMSLDGVNDLLDAHYLSRDVSMAERAVAKLETRTKPAK